MNEQRTDRGAVLQENADRLRKQQGLKSGAQPPPLPRLMRNKYLWIAVVVIVLVVLLW